MRFFHIFSRFLDKKIEFCYFNLTLARKCGILYRKLEIRAVLRACFTSLCGSSSVVELHLAKVEVASSNLVSRFHLSGVLSPGEPNLQRGVSRPAGCIETGGGVSRLGGLSYWGPVFSRKIWWRSQVVRPESAKLLCVGSIPTATFILHGRLAQVARAFA